MWSQLDDYKVNVRGLLRFAVRLFALFCVFAVLVWFLHEDEGGGAAASE